MHYETVRLILGDQLNSEHSWFHHVDDKVLYVIAEVHQESTYVTHHIQKVCAFFSAMAHFTKEKQSEGHHVLHLTLDDTQSFDDLAQVLQHYVSEVGATKFEYQRPDEYRLLEQLANITLDGVVKRCVDTEHFLLPFEEIEPQFPQGKHIMMEHFYRRMRKRFDILMQDGKPVGGKWNYDANNRNKLKVKDVEQLPQPLMFSIDVSDILERLQRHNIQTIGRLKGDLLWPVNRSQSLSLLAHFCQICLPQFGRFQDAMTSKHESKWSLYHSRLSFSMNTKLLHPKEVIEAALHAFRSNPNIDIAQVEGFIRQILGWREYIRGVYWANMPHYPQKNELDASRTLPSYFWTGETKMACMRHAIGQSLDYAYAHHIQRLMVTGNFCLLTEIDPDQVDEWYLGIYIDAIEWVEMPNTRGMALFADGGIVGTKPYAASGSYINKMSDYCKDCYYDNKVRSGEAACPFNSLYWRFMHKHEKRLATNPRIGMIFRSWDNMAKSQRQAILDTAEHYMKNLESL
ncbi:deoxyribodipyrimidine photolyase-related protein [Vibrio sp. ES.051]|uniref:cryptochrome/photolyase family protein n=1 Tax=Vibrio sp. ES.051 TaxID=1761909 RepID=UPI000BF6D0BB|nr:cryptochrome/photolyase family protein [Vibrio sp. ES.051]PFG58542.1 deoxyribodipyrimidine photolyase-related protein [Vibrio sp. ES.051]